jgi:hypothetical protein
MSSLLFRNSSNSFHIKIITKYKKYLAIIIEQRNKGRFITSAPQTLKNKKNYDRQTKRPNPVDMTFNFQRHITHISYELRLLEAERKSNYGVFNVVIEFKPFI